MRAFLPIAWISAPLALFALVACSQSPKTPQRRESQPPPAPDYDVRAREGGPGPIIRLKSEMTPEEAAAAGLGPPVADEEQTRDEEAQD